MNFKNIFKSYLLLTVSLIAGQTVQAQEVFTIKGQLATNKQGKILLSYRLHDKNVLDSADVISGAFVLKNKIADPSFAVLYLNRPKVIGLENQGAADFQAFFLEGADVTIKGEDSLKYATITGGKSQKEFLEFEKMTKANQKQISDIQHAMVRFKKELNDTAMQQAQQEGIRLAEERARIDSIFIQTHLNSYVSFDMWRRKHRGTVDAKDQTQFDKFSNDVRNSEAGKIFQKRFEFVERLAAGRTAPDFMLKDSLGRSVTLSSFKGKNVLLLMWTDFPGFEQVAFNLTRIHNRLQNKNLAIVSVYYPNNIKSGNDFDVEWSNAVARNRMNYMIKLQDFDGLDGDKPISDFAKSYGLSWNELPIAYLIGPDGKIIERHLPLKDKELSLHIDKLIN